MIRIRPRNLIAAAVTSLVMSLSAVSTAGAAELDANLCVLNAGPKIFVSDREKRIHPSQCAYFSTVTDRVFNTHKLTLARSAYYDPATKRFEFARDGGQYELLVPGEQLVIFDDGLGDRTLAYAVSSNRFMFVLLHNPASQLVPFAPYWTHGRQTGLAPYMIVGDGAEFSHRRDMKKSVNLRKSRIVGEIGAYRDEGGTQRLKVSCLDGTCPHDAGWVGQEFLRALPLDDLPKGPLPEVIIPSRGLLLKEAGREERVLSRQEIKARLEAGLKAEGFVDLELGASLEQIISLQHQTILPANLNVEAIPFVVTGYTDGRTNPRGQARSGWRLQTDKVILVAFVTYHRDAAGSRRYYKLDIAGLEYRFELQGKNFSFENSTQQKLFVDAVERKLGGRVEPWLLRYIAAELSRELEIEGDQASPDRARGTSSGE